MTSISATSGSYQSPLQLLQAELQSEVNSGTVSSSDQGALSSALTDINSALQGGNTADPAGSTTSTTNSSPGDLKSKIDNLIAGEVSSGKLTSQQATELQGVFQAAFANGPGGAGAPAGASSADTLLSAAPGGVPPGGAPPTGAGAVHHGHHGGHGASSSSGSSSSTGSSSSSSSSASSADNILQQFLQSLQDSLSSSTSNSYSATGNSSPGSTGGSSFSALLINYQT